MDKVKVKISVRNASKYKERPVYSSVGSDDTGNFRIGLSDSILKESFKLLLFGIGFSLCVFLVEVLQSPIRHGIALVALILAISAGFL